MHVSLDGYVAGPKGEMDWIELGDDMWDVVNEITATADTAIFGGVTFGMMESYWPTAADKPDASQHDKDHSKWVNAAAKIVFSKTRQKSDWAGTTILHDIVPADIQKMKDQPGKNLLMLGSPSIAQQFMDSDLIDEFWLNVNPVVLGEGKALFANIHHKTNLKLIGLKKFESGVVGLHYEIVR